MITITAYNIEYDTVDMDGVEQRNELSPSEIPTEVTFSFDPAYLLLNQFDDWVLWQIEKEWLIERFDYQITGPVSRPPVHVKCQARAVSGVPQFPHLFGKLGSYTAVRIFR